MGKYPKAEEMHLKAIEIKERLLGSEDYEVALSVGHLASLYNYDMQMYDKAEELYFRSIKIGKKLFGDGYSGLEYDYRGLLRLYHSMRNFEKAHEFQVGHCLSLFLYLAVRLVSSKLSQTKEILTHQLRTIII